MKHFTLAISLFGAAALSGCSKCENCTYYVETSNNTIEEPLGEFCGDAIKALENKEYADPRGEAHTECE